MIIKDLDKAATLDLDAMRAVRGGFSRDRFAFMEAMKYSFLESNSLQSAETLQGNSAIQSADVQSLAGGKGGFAGIEGGMNGTVQTNSSINVN